MPNLASKILRSRCPVLVAFSPGGQTILLPCGLWTCERCAKRNAREWARRVRLHMAENDIPWWFFTLTFGSDYRTPGTAFKALPGLWDGLRKQFARTYEDWQYVAFVEGQAATRGGMPHFHIISSYHPPSHRGERGQWTRRGEHDWAVARGFGFEIDVKPVISDQAAYYVTKYASKGDPAMPRGFRRVRASQSWTKIPDDPDRALLVPARGETLVHFLIRVQEQADLDIETLYQRWSGAQEVLKRANRNDAENDPDA